MEDCYVQLGRLLVTVSVSLVHSKAQETPSKGGRKNARADVYGGGYKMLTSGQDMADAHSNSQQL